MRLSYDVPAHTVGLEQPAGAGIGHGCRLAAHHRRHGRLAHAEHRPDAAEHIAHRTADGVPARLDRGFAVRVVGLDILANTLQAKAMADRINGFGSEPGEGGRAAGAGGE